MSTRAVIRATGRAVPEKIVTNADLEKLVDTTDEWIQQRTGIKERRICAEGETASTLAIEAAQKALAKANLEASDLDLVVCATVTGDMPFPSTSCIVQEAIGARNAGAYDLGAACAGFIYALSTVAGLIESNQFKRVLLVGVDVLSKYVDWTDRSTCILFGDGAGSAIVEAAEGTERGVIRTVLKADGSGAQFIKFDGGGSKFPLAAKCNPPHRNSVFMAGQETYRFAVNAMGDACCKVLDEAGMSPADVDLFVPHQANIRIIESAAERLKLPAEKVYVNVQYYGNTSGGSIPIALDEASEKGLLKQGDVVMTVGFGAGLVWGANLIRW